METGQPSNPFGVTAGGSPTGSPTAAGGMEMGSAEMTRRLVATEAAALAAQKAAEAVQARPTAEDSRSWWKLLPKPPTFDHATREAEIAAWKEWSWLLEQYLASVDPKITDDIQGVRAQLDRSVDMVDFSDSERQKNNFLYSMLFSLLRQRALLVVKQVTGNNGLEVYRLLVQQNEPASKNRSMSLLSVIVSWPAFNGKSSLMQQLLKLEHAYSEYERLGTKLNDDLKTAVLMRSITGQLKTWLQLQVNESTTYSKVREMVMMYDSQTTKWSEQMVLGVDAGSSSVDGPIPMEVDRIQSKGKQKGKGKGKTKDRDGQKGKSKGKQKGKDIQKGKGKFQKGAKGSSDGLNGKGKGEPKQCYVCGKTGHFARDCWQSSQIRNVASDMAQGSTVQGSPASSLGGMSSASHQQGAQLPTTPATQYKVARIVEVSEDVSRHDDLIFDMRDCSSPSSFHGSVHVVHHYIGDSSDDSMDVCRELCCFDGSVRAVSGADGDSCSERIEEVHSILIDSGADASIFPSSLFDKGRQVSGSIGKLCDAQGVEIPLTAVQDMEIRLQLQDAPYCCVRKLPCQIG